MARPFIKEISREFIHRALYANEYGYFQRNANIFHTPEPISFVNLRDLDEYTEKLSLLYKNQSKKEEEFYQLWHTPSELFRPWYGNAIASYIIQEHEAYIKEQSINGNNNNSKVDGDDTIAIVNEELVIIEIGPGNGTLCQDIVNYIQNYNNDIITKHDNHHSKNTIDYQYHLVEISKKLHEQQKMKFSLDPRINCHLSCILKWDPPSLLGNFSCSKPSEKEENKKKKATNTIATANTTVRPWILAMEVLDNMPHDRIMYDRKKGNLLQGWVSTNPMARYGQLPGRFHETYESTIDSDLLEAMRVLDGVNYNFPSLKWNISDMLTKFITLGNDSTSLWNNPWSTEFIPTRSINMLRRLASLWPQCRLIISDFGMELPGRISGWSSPRVQTRYKGDTIECDTFLLQPGLFDIFFPTDFKLLTRIHDFLFANKKSQIMKHGEFFKKYGKYENTTTKSGFNPLLEDFENVYFLLS